MKLRGLLKRASGGSNAVAPAPVSSGADLQVPVEDDPVLKLTAAPENYDEPWAFYEQMRQLHPVYLSVGGRRIATRYKVVQAIQRDSRFGVQARDTTSVTSGGSADALNKLNPPRHTEVRQLVGGPFSPKSIENYHHDIQELAHDLLDRVTGRAEFDVVQDFALPLGIGVIARIFGVPDRYKAMFREAGDHMAPTLDPLVTPEQLELAARASVALNDMFGELLEVRKVNPSDDLLTGFLNATEGDKRLTDAEVLANAQFTLLAGYATTVGLMGSALNILVDRPDMWQLLRDNPDLIPNAVEEFLRVESPVQAIRKIALEDVEVFGVEMPVGTPVATFIGAANRDPDMFPNPDEIDIHRPNANKHLAFSVGAHHCLGSSLSRLELVVAFRTLVARLPSIERAGPIRRYRGLVLRTLESMPITASEVLPRTTAGA